MNRAYRIIPCYTGDVSGVCSALFELGGMVVIHDPSGCNSTYNTHDETRWYDRDSLIFISGLAEIDAVMGNDEKFIEDVTDAALRLHPRFIALANSPIPFLNGTDFAAICRVIEARTGIPTFYLPTNGMHDYVRGAGEALAEFARRFAAPPQTVRKNTVNLLGVTPLDFAHPDAPRSLRAACARAGLEVLSCWAMGDDPEALARAGEAERNLVVSAVGLEAAKALQARFGTPYTVGCPVGRLEAGAELPALPVRDDWFLIGEPVTMSSLAAAIGLETGKAPKVLCPLEGCESLLSDQIVATVGEEDIENAVKHAKVVIADPLYRPICPKDAVFLPLPHLAFSGRCYLRQMENLPELDVKSLLKGATP